MAAKKKRLTNREKQERVAFKKDLQKEGVLPPNKPRLNRRKFAIETWKEFEHQLPDPHARYIFLMHAMMYLAPSKPLGKVSSEEIGVYKLLKIAVELSKFNARLQKEGRTEYAIGEEIDIVQPILKL